MPRRIVTSEQLEHAWHESQASCRKKFGKREAHVCIEGAATFNNLMFKIAKLDGRKKRMR